MCGRVDIHDLEPVKEDVKKYYEGNVEDYIVYNTLGYNIPPSTDLPVWHEHGGKGILESMHWGLIPHWAKERSTKYSMINARAEDVAKRPAYSSSFKRRRCLIPVNGFYEWQKVPGMKIKQPWYFTSKEKPYLLLAGLWDEWRDDQTKLRSCTILTTEPNEIMKPIHDRMPVILKFEDAGLWLDETLQDTSLLRHLLKPADEDLLSAWPVSPICNSPSVNEERCILPLKQ
ncbi:SOS response-associated peptidase [Hydrogenimonas urashimensis]|uniref:SOS response-associated peptidase n=1 Tax=Hydrogenimonas urashimensis TaxID=2740515 RepID=UPI0019159337|nr:SOS response-associated peptidase [Hydrogenimonas urashimensis]